MKCDAQSIISCSSTIQKLLCSGEKCFDVIPLHLIIIIKKKKKEAYCAQELWFRFFKYTRTPLLSITRFFILFSYDLSIRYENFMYIALAEASLTA